MQSIEDNCIDWNCIENKNTKNQCIEAECPKKQNLKEFIPLFISIEKFVNSKEKSLLNYLEFEYLLEARHLDKVLREGKTLILLDNLEILIPNDQLNNLKKIQDFIGNYYKNKFVATCRSTAIDFIPKKYFNNFTEVEIADFDDSQITDFANKWFQSNSTPQKANDFIKIINYERNIPIKILANSPLLLTLLCIVFQNSLNEYRRFPNSRVYLYQKSVDILLDKDTDRENQNIEQEDLYTSLLPKHKESLFTQLAYFTFNHNLREFKAGEIKDEVITFLSQLPNIDINVRTEININKFLKSIVAQHGLLIAQAEDLYSFSHLTLQEYFVAKYIVDNCDPKSKDSIVLRNLVQHVSNPKWTEIFLLTAEMLTHANSFLSLLKDQTDILLAEDDGLQSFLSWVDKQARSLEGNTRNIFSRSAIRACYLDFDIELDYARILPMLLDHRFTCQFTCASLLARAAQSSVLNTFNQVDEIHFSNQSHDNNYDINYEMSVTYRATAITLLLQNTDLKPELREKLIQLRDKLDELDRLSKESIDKDEIENWYKRWGNLLRETIVPYHSLGEEWGSYNFNLTQKKLLKKYYDANLILVNCLKISCVDPELRESIKDELILPYKTK